MTTPALSGVAAWRAFSVPCPSGQNATSVACSRSTVPERPFFSAEAFICPHSTTVMREPRCEICGAEHLAGVVMGCHVGYAMTPEPMTPSESLVYALCQQSFLSPWSYPRPLRRDGRELCDVLVLCEPDIVVFSVKEIRVGDHGDPSVDWSRWQRKAIDASAKQLYGAARELPRHSRIRQENGAPGLVLPPVADRNVHLVAVAVGGKREVPIYSGDLGKGHVHVFDEVSLTAMLQELDTIRDFVAYLTTMRAYHERGGRMVVTGGEEDVLALYLHRGRSLPTDADVLIVEDGNWAELQTKPEWLARKKEDRVSYVWDRLIEELFADYATQLRTGEDISNEERIVRTMAREGRFERRVLGAAFSDLLHSGEARARMLCPDSGIVYVFLAAPCDLPREDRVTELNIRCFIARGLHPDSATVVGIGTEILDSDSSGHSLDAVYLHWPAWTADDAERARYAQEEFGFFKAPDIKRLRMDEFPG